MDTPYGQDGSTPRDIERGDSTTSENGIQAPMPIAANALSDSPGNGQTLVVVPPSERPEHLMPVWMQRTCLIIYVLFCLEVGLMLTLVPWTQAWTHNTFIFGSQWLRSFLQTGFIRGLVTGIGLIDIWLGIWEAVQYRDVRPL